MIYTYIIKLKSLSKYSIIKLGSTGSNKKIVLNSPFVEEGYRLYQ